MSQRAFTLLETMVALVIVGLVVVAFLEVFGLSARATRNVETWAPAVAYAESGMELAKLDLEGAIARGFESLPGGYSRQVSTRPWGAGLRLATVTVVLPSGGRFVVERLVGDR